MTPDEIEACDHVHSWINYFVVWEWGSGKTNQYHEAETECVFCPKCGEKL